MAEFNPQINPLDPNYLGYSRGTDRAITADIGQVPNIREIDYGTRKANTSIGDALSNVAKIGAGLNKVIGDVIEETATERIRQGVETIRGPFTQDISSALGNPLGTQEPVIRTNEDVVPAELKNLDRRVGQLSSAKAAGKLTEAGYWLQLDNFARSMRQQFPGHKDFIDNKIAAYTGGNPANQLWRSQLSALQTLAAKASGNAEAEDKYIKQHADLLDPELRYALFSGDPSKRPSNNVMMYSISNNKAKREDLQNQSLEMTVLEKKGQLEEKHVAKYGEDLLRSSVQEALNGMLSSPEGEDMIKRINAKEVPSAVEAQQINTVIAEMEQRLRLGVNQLADRGIYSDKYVGEAGPDIRYYGPSLRTTLKDNYNSVVERALGDFNTIRDRVYNKDYGIFPFMKSWNDMRSDERIRNMGKQYPIFEIIQDINRTAGQAGVELLLGKGGGLSDVQSAVGAVLAGRVAKGDAVSLRDQMNYLKTNGFTEKANPEVFTQAIDKPIGFILNDKVELPNKLQNARVLFSDESLETISKLGKRSQDAVFDKITSKQFVEAMGKIKDKDLFTWTSYTKFIKDHFVPSYREYMGDIGANNADNKFVTFGFDAKSKQIIPLAKTPEQDRASKEFMNTWAGNTKYYQGGRMTTVESKLLDKAAKLNAGIQKILPILERDNPNFVDYEIARLLRFGGLNLVTPTKPTTTE